MTAQWGQSHVSTRMGTSQICVNAWLSERLPFGGRVVAPTRESLFRFVSLLGSDPILLIDEKEKLDAED
jgi:hypothetical protein